VVKRSSRRRKSLFSLKGGGNHSCRGRGTPSKKKFYRRRERGLATLKRGEEEIPYLQQERSSSEKDLLYHLPQARGSFIYSEKKKRKYPGMKRKKKRLSTPLEGKLLTST